MSVVLFGLFAGASGAAAAPSGVHFDPDSPAGQEYALPLERAREEATGIDGGETKGEAAPLFGIGVSDGGSGQAGPGSGTGDGPQGAPAAGDGASGSRPEEGGTARSQTGAVSGPADFNLADDDEAGFSLITGLAMVAALLFAAAVAGLALRRLPPAPPTEQGKPRQRAEPHWR